MRKMIRSVMLAGLVLGGLSTASGCAFVKDTMNGNANLKGDIWWVRAKTFSNDRVFYCPPPTGGAPAQCKEAKMIEGPAK